MNKDDIAQWVMDNIYGTDARDWRKPAYKIADTIYYSDECPIPHTKDEAYKLLCTTYLFHGCEIGHLYNLPEKISEVFEWHKTHNREITIDITFYQYFLLCMDKLKNTEMMDYVNHDVPLFQEFTGEKGGYTQTEDIYERLFTYDDLYCDFFNLKNALQVILG